MYLVTQREIEANPDRLHALREMPLPYNKCGVQRLTGRIVVLNRASSLDPRTNVSLSIGFLKEKKTEARMGQQVRGSIQKIERVFIDTPNLGKTHCGRTALSIRRRFPSGR